MINVFSPDNNYPPVLDMSHYTGYVTENIDPAGTFVLNITVTDNDKFGSDNILSDLTLTGEDASFFYIEVFGNYGTLRTKYVNSLINVLVRSVAFLFVFCLCVMD